jgi:hypothetical protein
VRGRVVVLRLAVAVGAQAQGPVGAYPNRPVRLVVPYALRGNIDITGRIVAPARSDAKPLDAGSSPASHDRAIVASASTRLRQRLVVNLCARRFS